MDKKLLKIKGLLKSKNLTYEQFGKLIGKSKPTIVNWFKGASKIDIDTIEKIASALGVPVSYFFDESGVGQAINVGIINKGQAGDIQQIINHSHELEKENAQLKAELQGCRELLKAKDEIINLLKQQTQKLN